MRLTIDTSSDPLANVLKVLSAAYAVQIARVDGDTTSPVDESSTKARRRKGSARPRKSQASGIRQWALDNGFEVSSRGVLPREVTEAFAASQR